MTPEDLPTVLGKQVRIVSDGRVPFTQILIDGVLVPGVRRVTWALEDGGKLGVSIGLELWGTAADVDLEGPVRSALLYALCPACGTAHVVVEAHEEGVANEDL